MHSIDTIIIYSMDGSIKLLPLLQIPSLLEDHVIDVERRLTLVFIHCSKSVVFLDLTLVSPKPHIVRDIVQTSVSRTVPTNLGPAWTPFLACLVVWIAVLDDGLLEVLQKVTDPHNFGDDSEVHTRD